MDYEERLKTGRNDRCLCGSGKKYKKCHLAEDERARGAALGALQAEAQARAAENEDEDDADPSATGKGKQARKKMGGSGNKPQAAGHKPKNMPRRGAV